MGGQETGSVREKSSKLAGKPKLSCILGVAISGVLLANPAFLRAQAIDLPPSMFASEQAQAAARAAQERAATAGPRPSTDDIIARDGILSVRQASDNARRSQAAALEAVFPVRIRQESLGGVATEILEPAAGIAPRNRHRVLLNLHGGGFFLGARYEGRVASIPIAALGRIKVISVDYRLAPEHRFPAASEDVAKVYKALLRTYRPENIGIYGCSAGATLTAQAVAWIQRERLPAPGAISLEGGGATAGGLGDSYYVANAIDRVVTPKPPPPRGNVYLQAYFGEEGFKEPLQSPAFHADVLRKFPPTLLMTATRDFRMSTVVFTQSQMVAAGVRPELHVWDGVGHCFSYDADLPESRQAYGVMIDFFERHLGRRRR